MDAPVQTALQPRALVTGGTGFIGSHLVRSLHDAGWCVHLLARPDAAREAQAAAGVPLHPYRGEMDDVMQAVARSKPDVVFHLASLFLAQHTAREIAPLIQANVLLGTQLLEAMSEAGVHRFIHAGTSWQYFHQESFRPVNLYAATKQAFEDILAFYTETAGIRAITLLLFDSYGPGDARKKLLRLLIDCLETKQGLEMSPGDQVLDLVHVDDLCAAFLHAAGLVADPAHPARRSYAISGGERMTVRELVAVLEKVAGASLRIDWGARPYRPREVMRPWDGPALPGWRPRISIQQGFRQLLDERSL